MFAPRDLIDLTVYARNAGSSFIDLEAAYEHFRAHGQAAGINPSAYFETSWYAWQNPDHKNHETVLDHFAAKACASPVDPAPFIDSVYLLRQHPELTSALDLYRQLLSGGLPGIEPGATAHLERLARNRSAYLDAIDFKCLRDRGRNRRNLLWVQSGRSSRLADWFSPDAPRSWDLLCNFYEMSGLDLRHGEVILRQSGTKFSGISVVLERLPELLGRYDQVMFIDDDLEFEHSGLDRVFTLATEHRLDMFQPSLSKNSYCVWPELFSRPGSEVRLMSGVEVMMFGFSKRALAACAPLFRQSVSGFGLDFACSEVVRAQNWRCGIIDGVEAIHPKQISEANGSYYEFLRKIGVSQKLELFEVIQKYRQFPNFVTIS